MKHAKNKNCPICNGEGVVYKKGKGRHTGYYEVCECSAPKEESEMSGADGPNSGER